MTSPTRRRTLLGLGTTLAAGLFGVTATASAQSTDPAEPEQEAADSAVVSAKVDVHSHYLTPTYRQALIDSGNSRPDGMSSIPDWSPEGALRLMTTTGVAHAMLSISSPGVSLGDAAENRRLARSVNEEGAQIVADHPTRFGLLASLPLPDVEAAVAEARYALDQLKADGITLETNYHGVYLSDEQFDPLMAELHERQAVVLLHPTSPACFEETSFGRPRPMIEFLFDTTRTVTELVLRGVMDTYPGIRFVIPHAGAALPVLADRIAAFALEGQVDVNVMDAFRRLHYDVAGFSATRAVPALLKITDSQHLLYGSDYPFTSAPVVTAQALALEVGEALTASQKEQMFSLNARELFPRLSQVPAA
ncbi:amidohydrolase family protein [Streptomyces sp. SID1121]|uniref:amidohydrolase family protein n=1 Tax=Streptomyces sp. SID1121 TaxID=3425888 RepID=UPI004056DD5E